MPDIQENRPNPEGNRHERRKKNALAKKKKKKHK